jgi:hypothetical protein
MAKYLLQISGIVRFRLFRSSGLLARDNFRWRALSRWQFARFRNRLASGHEFVALAVKTAVKAAAKTTVKTAAKDGGEGRST